MVWHVAFGQLDYNIGGYFPISGMPQYPALEDVPTEEYSWYSPEMNWFIFGGDDDTIYPQQQARAEFYGLFETLEI